MNDIISEKKMRERIIKIAKGELKPYSREPKIWYESEKTKKRIKNK